MSDANPKMFGGDGPFPPAFFDRMSKHDREELEQLRLEKEIVRAAADQAGLYALALQSVPSDMRSFGELHGIPTFAETFWVQAFMAGWRARPVNQQEEAPNV